MNNIDVEINQERNEESERDRKQKLNDELVVALID
jgi:hypothetical protein